MKKLIAAALCMMLVLSCSATVFAAEKTTFAISPETVEAAPGDTIAFSISIEAGDSCRTLGVIPQFDAAVFEIVDGQTTVAEALISTYTPGRGFVFLFAEAVKLKGQILTFQLKVRDAAPADTYEIDFKVSMMGTNEPLETEVESAQITVVRPGSDSTSKPSDPPTETEKPTEPDKATDPAGSQPTDAAPEDPSTAETHEAPTAPPVTVPEETREFKFPLWAIPVYVIGISLIILILIILRKRK